MDAAVEPDAERILRNAKRVRRAFRLIFYPGAAIAAVLLLTAGRDADGMLSGRTQQGAAFTLQLDGDRPLWFDTELTATCPGGGEYRRHWASTRPIVVRDGIAELEQTTGTVTLRMRARVDGGAVTGTMWMENWVGAYACRSDVVSFSAG